MSQHEIFLCHSVRTAIGTCGGSLKDVTALTVNRVCGPGAQDVVSAALEIWPGTINCAIGGGMENIDRKPYLLSQGRLGPE